MKLAALSVLLVALLASLAAAQVPIVQVYLDSELLTIHRDCPGHGIPDTLYVAVSNFTQPILDIEYRVETYGNFALLGDFFPNGFSGLGTSGTGIRVAFGGPIDASGTVLVQSVVGGWFCSCSEINFPYFVVQPHPESGKVQATAWPDLTKIEATGGVNFLCGTVPVESSTWGRIKALYR